MKSPTLSSLLEQYQALAGKITPGQWCVDDSPNCPDGPHFCGIEVGDGFTIADINSDIPGGSNAAAVYAEFIAFAANHFPTLVEEVERLNKKHEIYERANGEAHERRIAAEAALARNQEALNFALTKLRKIAPMGFAENDRLRKHGYVFERPFMGPPPTDEAAKWEWLAFWLHTDLWEAATEAGNAIGEIEAEAALSPSVRLCLLTAEIGGLAGQAPVLPKNGGCRARQGSIIPAHVTTNPIHFHAIRDDRTFTVPENRPTVSILRKEGMEHRVGIGYGAITSTPGGSPSFWRTIASVHSHDLYDVREFTALQRVCTRSRRDTRRTTRPADGIAGTSDNGRFHWITITNPHNSNQPLSLLPWTTRRGER